MDVQRLPILRAASALWKVLLMYSVIQSFYILMYNDCSIFIMLLSWQNINHVLFFLVYPHSGRNWPKTGLIDLFKTNLYDGQRAEPEKMALPFCIDNLSYISFFFYIKLEAASSPVVNISSYPCQNS